jgi:uncharacterized damage-inducible protein DinB
MPLLLKAVKPCAQLPILTKEFLCNMEQEIFKDLLIQNQTSCSFAFNKINDENIGYRLNDQAASVGFIYRHVGGIMNMFGCFFGVPTEVQNTTMGKPDEGQGNNLEESRQLVEKGYTLLQNIIDSTPNGGWLEPVETPFFGTVSKARLFAHVLYHNSYHAGQIGLTLKRGKP